MDYEKLFAFYDKNGDGLISLAELEHAIRRDLRLAPAEVSDRQVETLFVAIDQAGGGGPAGKGGDGGIELSEFINFLVDGK